MLSRVHRRCSYVFSDVNSLYFYYNSWPRIQHVTILPSDLPSDERLDLPRNCAIKQLRRATKLCDSATTICHAMKFCDSATTSCHATKLCESATTTCHEIGRFSNYYLPSDDYTHHSATHSKQATAIFQALAGSSPNGTLAPPRLFIVMPSGIATADAV